MLPLLLLSLSIFLQFGATMIPTDPANIDARVPKRQLFTRYLVFPEGSNVQLVYCLTVTTYSKPVGMFTIGITAGLAWELPSSSTLARNTPPEVYHRRTRRQLYRKLESILKTRGKDGSACVLKAICNAARRTRTELGKGSFLQEILHSVFTLPGGFYDIDPITEYERAYLWQENCSEAGDRCPDVF